ncbi:MAG: protein kinase [Gemmatimonadetes bacterium]|nr:protein kinase [Gemmatimonadota bacterium]
MSNEIRDRLARALGDQYELGPEIGRGGMGVVFRAVDTRLQRNAAIKVLPPELSYRDDLRERFTREAQLAGGLSHPNIVPIYDVGEGEGLVWYEMAFVDGESVRARVERDGPLTEPQTRRIIREVAWALGYAHARGIVHRDIKPDNILLESGTGRSLVTDFGIAKMAEGESATLPGTVLGSLMYMAPEQATGEGNVDGRADIYSLGLCGHFMLGGRPPFEKATVITVAARIATGATPDFDEIEQPIDPMFRQLLERCVATDPDERWQDAEAILDALGPQAIAPRPMPASIRRLVRDFMLVPTLGFLVLVIDVITEDPTLGQFIGWMAVALCVNFGITLRKFTERGFRWPDLREGLDMEIARQAEELEATGALRDRFKALMYIAVPVGAFVEVLAAGMSFPAALAIAIFGGLPIAWLGVKIVTFLGRMGLKLLPSLPKPESEKWFPRFLDRLLTKLFRPLGAADDDLKALPAASSGWSTSDVGAARRSTHSIDDLFAELPRDLRRHAHPARELARALTSAIDSIRGERAQIDREHGQAIAELGTWSRQATHTLEQLRALIEDVADGKADASAIAAKVAQGEDLLRDEQGDKRETGSGSRRSSKWLGGVLLDSAVTGSAPYRESDSGLRRLATDITAAWDRREDLQQAFPEPDTGVHQCIDRIRELDASIALHKQRGKRLDPTAAQSVTQCESLLAQLLETLRRHDAEADGGTKEIDALVEKIDELHVEIDAALEV